jgi:DNA-binding SARP family transcriptional activator
LEKTVEIRLLGELQVVFGGRLAKLPPSKKTRALLSYLVASGQAQLRARLCDLLWDGPDDPRAGLRWSLSKLRSVFDEAAASGDLELADPFRASAERVEFVASGATVDLREHRADMCRPMAALAVDALEGAAARFRGDFLEGLELPDCYRFHEWCIAEREALRRERVAILAALVERLHHAPERALGHARAWAQIEPTAEAAHAAVVGCLARLGRRKEALQQYDRCRHILETELGAKPSALLERARTAVGLGTVVRDTGRPAPAEGRVAATKDAGAGPRLPGGELALVGRAAEREALRTVLARAIAGEPTGPVAFSGEPGVGKTRLLSELAAGARANFGLALSGRAFEAEMVRPYGSWIDALRSVPLGRAAVAVRREVSALLPELAEAPAESVDRTRLFDAVVGLLASLVAPERPVVVALDDVQWIDEASAALVHYVARASVPGLVLAVAARPGELDDNPAAVRLWRALRRESNAVALSLGPLSSDETVNLVRELDPLADPSGIFAESEGHPLFTIELVRARRQQPDETELPSTLNGLLRERLEKLDLQAQAVVSWAAALGRSFRLGVLVDVLGRTPPDVLAIMDELERRGIFCSAAAGTTQFGYDFSHDLVRRAAYDRVSEPRRKLYHAHIANVLARSLESDDALAGEVLRHAARGGDDALAARASRLAARRCLRLFAYPEAAEIADRGRRHAMKLGVVERLTTELPLLSVLAEAEALRRSSELEQALVRAISEAHEIEKHELVIEAYRILSMLQHQVGNVATSAENLGRAAENVGRAAEAGRAAPIHTVVSAVAHAGRCYAMVGREITRARELLGEARVLAERHRVAESEILLGEACLAQFDGDAEGAERLFEMVLPDIRSAQDHWRECECLVRLAMGAIDRGAWREAGSFVKELGHVAVKMGEGATEPQVAMALEALIALGARAPAAGRKVEAALSMLRAIDTKGMLAYALGTVGRIELESGAAEVAAARAAEALKMALLVHSEDEAAFARALACEAAWNKGDRDAARAWLVEASVHLGRKDVLSARARAAIERARAALEGS